MGTHSRKISKTKVRIAETQDEIARVQAALEARAANDSLPLEIALSRLRDRLTRQQGTLASWEALDGLPKANTPIEQSIEDTEKATGKRK